MFVLFNWNFLRNAARLFAKVDGLAYDNPRTLGDVSGPIREVNSVWAPIPLVIFPESRLFVLVDDRREALSMVTLGLGYVFGG